MADEKDEKSDEKEMEKREEKSPEEKNWDEKWRRDPINAITWACIFIWAGLVFLLDNLGMIDTWKTSFTEATGWSLAKVEAWSLIFLGAGVILLIEVLLRLLIPSFRKPVMGTLIFAAIMLGIGLGNIFRWEVTGALILIAIGIGILLRWVTARR